MEGGVKEAIAEDGKGARALPKEALMYSSKGVTKRFPPGRTPKADFATDG